MEDNMNRKTFLKRIGAGAIIAAVTPMVLAEKPVPIKPTASTPVFGIDALRVPAGDPSPAKIIPADVSNIRIVNMKPSLTPLDTIIKDAKKRGYDFSESD